MSFRSRQQLRCVMSGNETEAGPRWRGGRRRKTAGKGMRRRRKAGYQNFLPRYSHVPRHVIQEGDQLQVQPEALPRDREGVITKRVPTAKRESMRKSS